MLDRNSWRSVRRVCIVGLVAAVCGAGVTACGDDDDEAAGAPAATTTAAAPAAAGAAAADGGTDYAATLAKLWKGDFVNPPTSGPAPQKGKNVWYVMCGANFDTCVKAGDAFKEAGEALGWNVKVAAGNLDPATTSRVIKQAIASKADAIAVMGVDCAQIKTALLEAKAAKIPVGNWGANDCDVDGSSEPLFVTVKSRGNNFAEIGEKLAQARMDAVVAYNKGDVSLLELAEQSTGGQKLYREAGQARLKELCPDCKVKDVKYTFAQLPQPAMQVFKNAIQANPDANAMVAPDALFPVGLATVITSSGRADDLTVVGMEAPAPAMDAIRSGALDGTIATFDYTWQQWGLADTLNRVFAGETDLPDEGGGWMLVDKDHNMPTEKGKGPALPVDFPALYKKLWASSGQ